ncbi:MAG: RNA polymerase sigma factor [Marinirhabdus sp.]|nr:RNA polymerase sigma factor [Marinirhabdus sp.]
MKQHTDQHLITQTLRGHTPAFGELVLRYQDFIYTVVLRMVKQREEAEEIAQDTFVKAFEKLDTFQGNAKFSSWLYSIAYRKGLDHLKKKKRYQPSYDIESIGNDVKEAVENGLQQLMAKERTATIQQCMMELSETNAAVLTFYYYDDLSVKEIAEITDLSEDNIKIRLYRGRKELYSLLAPHIKNTDIHHGKAI